MQPLHGDVKLAVSNIAWDNAGLRDHLALLRDLGCNGVELAPSTIWPEPAEASATERRDLKRLVSAAELEVAGFHALLYTRPDLQLFRDRASLDETADYLIELARLLSELGGRVLVLGSPRNRVRHGRSDAECMSWAAEACARVARACEPLGVTLCIEPLGPDETEFIRGSDEGATLVERVAHPNFMLHLDSKALLAMREDLERVLARWGKYVRHFHVSDAGLAPPGSTGADHRPFGRALRRAEYRHYVSVEMRRGFGPSREVVASSVNYVKENYLAA